MSNGVIESQQIRQVISTNEVFVSKLTEEDLQTLLDIFVSIDNLNNVLNDFASKNMLDDCI